MCRATATQQRPLTRRGRLVLAGDPSRSVPAVEEVRRLYWDVVAQRVCAGPRQVIGPGVSRIAVCGHAADTFVGYHSVHGRLKANQLGVLYHLRVHRRRLYLDRLTEGREQHSEFDVATAAYATEQWIVFPHRDFALARHLTEKDLLSVDQIAYFEVAPSVSKGTDRDAPLQTEYGCSVKGFLSYKLNSRKSFGIGTYEIIRVGEECRITPGDRPRAGLRVLGVRMLTISVVILMNPSEIDIAPAKRSGAW